jgi:tRNA threonylcarbamoyladenosine biosynthesis protein TsaB
MSSTDPELLLAIETSARVGSVAIQRAGRPAVLRALTGDRRHTAELMPAIQDLLGEHNVQLSDVDVLAWACGPGSFTGLRIGATVARMAASAAKCRIVSVPTLDVIARNAQNLVGEAPTSIVVILDAQTERIYAATYVCRGVEPLRRTSEPAVYENPAEVLAKLAPPFLLLGEGVTRHRAVCEASGGTIAREDLWAPSASAVAELGMQMAAAGRFAEPNEILPLYLRPPACEEVYEKRRAEARARRGE